MYHCGSFGVIFLRSGASTGLGDSKIAALVEFRIMGRSILLHVTAIGNASLVQQQQVV